MDRSEAAHAKDEWIELLEVPQLREIETDRRGGNRAPMIRRRRQPVYSAYRRGPYALRTRRFACRSKRLQSEGRLFDRRWGAVGSAPSTVGILCRKQPLFRPPGQPSRLVSLALQLPKGNHHTSGPVGRVLLGFRVLVAEPQRNPGSIGALRLLEIANRARDSPPAAPRQRLRQVAGPERPRQQGVGREVRTAAVKRKMAPAAAESRHSPIPVLQIEQPANAVFGRGAHRRIRSSQVSQ